MVMMTMMMLLMMLMMLMMLMLHAHARAANNDCGEDGDFLSGDWQPTSFNYVMLAGLLVMSAATMKDTVVPYIILHLLPSCRVQQQLLLLLVVVLMLILMLLVMRMMMMMMAMMSMRIVIMFLFQLLLAVFFVYNRCYRSTVGLLPVVRLLVSDETHGPLAASCKNIRSA